MKSIHQVWAELEGDSRDNLVICCREIRVWQKTGTLINGKIREFARQLNDAGFPSPHTLALAENHIAREAMDFTIQNLE